ncbi:MAG: (2Fe-2S)-binding protein [Proteobacteria bacterium]|jgi:isoquinoline 1-oxidoreductase alpha subunit|nr:(2Fe-2S)-binding protein [Pseudomonadota bacterium]
MTTSLKVNGKAVSIDAVGEMPLLWVLREQLGLTGTKYGCGIGACGACTVHLDGTAMRACQVPLEMTAGKEVLTIEGYGADGLHLLQKAWITHQVPQCGYCQSGMIMAAADLLKRNPAPSDADIRQAITNLCRCGTYERIIAAILDAASQMRNGQSA